MGRPEQWLEKAREDLAVARLALGNGLWSPACFHARQTGEKALKSLFEAAGLPVPRSHDLDALIHGWKTGPVSTRPGRAREH